MARLLFFALALTGILLAAVGCAGQAKPGTLTIYSGRNEKLVDPVLQQFAKETGTDIRVRYGDTAELAATILEEGANSPADVFFAQDAGALGAVAQAGRFRGLPEATLNKVNERYRSPKGEWVGLSGRARVVAYNTQKLKAEELPESILGFTDPKWKDKIGWPPTNGSFQAFVTALRLTEGDAGARAWLQGILRNQAKAYPNNIAIVDAVGRGEIEVGFVNHYYLSTFLRDKGPSFPVRNHHLRDGGPGAMINVAGVGVLKTAKDVTAAEQFVEYLLSKHAQEYFAQETFEYPLIKDVQALPDAEPLDSIRAPKLDLGNLSDLQGTLRLLRDAGVL